jgi:hypothetical protein
MLLEVLGSFVENCEADADENGTSPHYEEAKKMLNEVELAVIKEAT